MSDLRGGVAGMGGMGRNHARVMMQMPGVELCAVFDPDPNWTDPLYDDFRLTSWDEFVREDLDYCVIAAPTDAHVALGVELAGHGCSILVEKPVANSYAEGLQLQSAVADSGVTAGVGHIERFNVAVVEMRGRVAAGELGEVFQIATRRQGPFPERIRDVGVVLDLATHDLDMASWIGESPYATVSAQTSHRAGRTTEDLVVVSGRLDNGIVVNHLVNWLTPFKEREVMVTGERGAFVADTLSGDLTFIENPVHYNEWAALGYFRGVAEGNRIRYALQKREPLLVEHEDFRDAIRAGSSPSVPIEVGLAAVRIAEAVLVSARSGGKQIRIN